MNQIAMSNHFRETYRAPKASLSCRRRLYGIGVNDADYITQPVIDGRIRVCPAYNTWKSVMARSYSQDYKSKKPTYLEVTACPEWASFMIFRAWWLDNSVDGWHIDKDLLKPGNMVYCPEACIFVPVWLNSMLTDSAAQRGEFPIGVTPRKNGTFAARCCMGDTTTVFLGYFRTPELAHAEWLKAKLSYAESRKSEMDAIDKRIYQSVISLIADAK